MRHNVTVSVNEDEKSIKVLNAREITLREKVLTALFGRKAKVLVVTPFNSVNEITIEQKGGNRNDINRSLTVGSY